MALFELNSKAFETWFRANMSRGKRIVPARLLTLLGLLERLRTNPKLDPEQHLTGNRQQLIEHNTPIETVLIRFAVESPLTEYGRRANDVGRWIEPLFSWLTGIGFSHLNQSHRDEFLTAAQNAIIPKLVAMNEDKPLLARYNKGTPVAVIADILDQAQAKHRAKDVAEYLVGAKLQLKFGPGMVEPKNVNTPSGSNLADFRIATTAIEVTVVQKPDKRHLRQLAKILENTTLDVWFLTRLQDRSSWQTGIELEFGKKSSRIACADIETFVGQNISEIGKFKSEDVKRALVSLFQQYNDVWLPKNGANGLEIVDAEVLS